MQSEITVLVWNVDNPSILEKIAKSGVNNVAISVDAGEVTEDVLEQLNGLGKRVLAKQFSSPEAIEELCAVLDTTDVLIDFSSAMIVPDMTEEDITLGLDTSVYTIHALLSESTYEELKVATDEEGLYGVRPIFIVHGPAEKILKSISKSETKYQSLALTFVEYNDRPQFYLVREMFSAFTNELVIWSGNSLDNMVLVEPEKEPEPVRAGTEIECIKSTSVRIAPSFASRIDTELSVLPGERYAELESVRAPGSTAYFSKINIKGKDRWVVRKYNSEEYFVDVN